MDSSLGGISSALPHPDPPHTLDNPPGLGPNKLSCTRCRQRKIRCNRRFPCDHCTDAKVPSECAFPSRRPRRRKTNDAAGSRDAELLRRVKQLESIITRIAADPTQSARSTHHAASVNSPTELPAHFPETKPSPDVVGDPFEDPGLIREQYKLFVKRSNSASRHVSGDVWEGLAHEFDGLRQILEQPGTSEDDEHDETYLEDEKDSPAPGTFPFGGKAGSHDLLSYYPSTPHRIFLLRKYFQTVHPIFAICHKITTIHLYAQDTFLDASTGRIEYPSMEAVFFACLLTAVISLTPEECLEHLGTDREDAITHYMRGTELALTAADFMNSKNVQCVEAIALYTLGLGSTRFASTGWAMTALVVRLAQGLGLDSDGEGEDYTQIERQIRRRAWWNILALDMRVCAERGSEPIIKGNTFNTARFSNVTDEMPVVPGDKSLRPETYGVTEISPSLIIADAANTARSVNFTRTCGGRNQPDSDEKERLVQECLDRIDTIYLSGADEKDPNIWFLRMLRRYTAVRLWLSIQYTPKGQSPGMGPYPRETSLELAVQNLEIYSSIEVDERSKKFHWYMRPMLPAAPLAVVLVEVCRQSTGPLIERGWAVIEQRWGIWRDRIRKTGDYSLWRPLQRLLRAAQKVRQEALDGSRNGQPAFQPTTSSAQTTQHQFPTSNNIGTPTTLDPTSQGLQPFSWSEMDQHSESMLETLRNPSVLPGLGMTDFEDIAPDVPNDWSMDLPQFPTEFDANDVSMPVNVNFNEVWPYQIY